MSQFFASGGESIGTSASASVLSTNAAAAKSLQSCLALCNPIDVSPPGSPVPGILQARILEWVAMPFSRGFLQPRDQTDISRQLSTKELLLLNCGAGEDS